ncbi:MAG TPA: metallophosphoesterase [Candidatus Acidoferrales bacterium]|nr:metallophosphoesterase [Candidatus Acidoferrales bacterium]
MVQVTLETNSSVHTAARPTRRLWKRPWFRVLIVVAFALCVDALIEPYRIQTTHYRIQGTVTTPLKVAALSDLHTHGLGSRERHMVSILAAEKPDVIVITGDSLGGYGGTWQEVQRVYQQLHAPLGVWFVRGNWENNHPYRPIRRERQFYEDSGVRLLVNANAQLRPDVWLIGLDDPSSGTVRLDRALAGVPSNAYKIAAFHAPGYFDHIAGRVNLVLAGHTHGGQVHIPFIPTFWLPDYSGSYVAGWYTKNGSKMYVNRGIGWTALPIRLLCRPEVTIITVEPEAKTAQLVKVTDDFGLS